MSDAFAYSAGVAVSPLPVVLVLVLLSGVRPRRSTLFYVLGLAAGTAAATCAIVAAVQSLDVTETPDAVEGVQVGVGVALVAIAVGLLLGRSRLRRRPLLDRAAELPPRRAAIAGFVLPLVNPKNLSLTLAAVIEVVSVGRPLGGTAMIVAVSLSLVAAIGSLGLLVPRTARSLGPLRVRLARWEVEIATVICFLLAAKLLHDGL